jgi:hypothetical protein
MTCQEPIDIPNVANTILQNAHILLMGDSMAWQLHQLLHCLYNNNNNATTNNTIHFDFQPLHIFPVHEFELEAAIDAALQKAPKPYRYSALILAIGTWYNWDWEEQNDPQQQQQPDNNNNGTVIMDPPMDPDGPESPSPPQQQQQQQPGQVRLETILRDQCPDGRAATYFTDHPLGNASTDVYEYAQRMRTWCGPLLRREAFTAGLTMLQDVIARRQQQQQQQRRGNDNDKKAVWPVVLWKQVSVQHFNTTSGNFDIIGGDDQSRSSIGCVPIRNITLNYERNRVAESILLQQQQQQQQHDNDDTPSSPHIHIIRTYDSEKTAYDQHVSIQDCTHYCIPSPTMLDWVDATMTQLLLSTQL